MICKTCGGIVGQTCFSPEECSETFGREFTQETQEMMETIQKIQQEANEDEE